MKKGRKDFLQPEWSGTFFFFGQGNTFQLKRLSGEQSPSKIGGKSFPDGGNSWHKDGGYPQLGRFEGLKGGQCEWSWVVRDKVRERGRGQIIQGQGEEWEATGGLSAG